MSVSTVELQPCGEGDPALAHYRKMFDRISALGRIGVWECELPVDRLSWTETVYDLFEIPRGTPILREHIVAMYEPESRARLEAIRGDAIRAGSGFTLDAQIRTGRGRQRWIRITAEIEMEHGRAARIFGTKQDISSERATLEKVRRLQTELIHVSRINAMSAMASTLAHELNQPLAAISNYLAAARRLVATEGGADELANCVADAAGSAHRAGEIIRRLREMTVNSIPRQEWFEVGAAIEEAVALATAGRPNVDMTCGIDPPARLVGDRIQIQQVLLNLIQNSIEAAGDRPCRIRIVTMARAGELDICVFDDGPGIRPDLLPNIFESLVTSKPQGMGIGLSVSRTIVENHGGRIAARNLPEGGACVCLTLPSD